MRDATASALAGLIRDAGGEPVAVGIVPDDRDALESTLRAALADADLVVVSAGSSVGARDETAGAVAALRRDLVPRAGREARQADAAGRVLRHVQGASR